MSYSTIEKYCSKRSVSLVAVSKTKPAAAITEMYAKGQRVFGENKVQELVDKQAKLPEDIDWHFIGHLQRNKVKHIAAFISLIHSVDSEKLIQEINKQGAKVNRIIPVLLQFYIASEESKFGLDWSEAEKLLDNKAAFANVQICGVMGMASFTSDEVQVRQEFGKLKKVFEKINAKYFPNEPSFKTISMGMSGDYEIAIEEGSNMVRIGSLLFGARNY